MLLLCLVVEVILNRRCPAVDAPCGVGPLHDDDAVAVGIGQPLHQRAVDDAEHRRREADAERQRERRDDARPGLLSRLRIP